MGNLGSCLTDG